MKNYKVMHEAKDHFVLHDSNDNKKFKLPKKALSEKMYQQVKALPRMAAEGGIVGGEPVSSSSSSIPEGMPAAPTFSEQDIVGQNPQPQLVAQNTSAIGSNPLTEQGNPDQTLQFLPPASQNANVNANASTPEITPTASPATKTPSLFPGNKDILEGGKAEANAGTQLANQKANTYNDLSDQMEFNDADFAQQHKVLDDQSNQLYSQIAAGKIDPNHYWNSKSTGNKIGTALAIALGGLGGGISGKGGNSALDVVNKAIDNDIQEQKANLDNKRSLLSMNLERTHSLEAAEQLTRSQMLTAAQVKLDQAGAKAQGDVGQANYLKLQGALKNQVAQTNAQVAQLQAAKLSQNKLLVGEGTIQDVANSSPEQKELLVKNPIDDTYAQATSKDEAKELRKDSAAYGSIASTIQSIDKLGPEAAIPGTPANRQAVAKIANLKTAILGDEGMKRLNPEVQKLLNDQLGNPSGIAAIVGANGATNRAALLQNLRTSYNNKKQAMTFSPSPYVPKTVKPGFN